MNKTIPGWLATMAATAVLVAGLAACGGGGGGDDSQNPPPGNGGGNPPPAGGIDGVGIAAGAISGFGSIIVNGVKFSTTNATFRIEDSPGSESDLEVGDIVEVEGRISDDGKTGTAETVSFNDSVEGPVSDVSLATSTLDVLGQTVRVTGTTIFDDSFSNPSLAGISAGDIVEVSGFPDGSGAIVATRIEPKPAGGTYELFGVVSSLDTNARRFNLSTTLVNYASATLPNGSPSNGACVEVKGNTFASGVLTATRVEVKACNGTVANGDRGEIEGVITRFASATDFSIGTRSITTNATTTYEGGTAADLRLNVKVEAEGSFNAAGVLVAKKVAFKKETSARLLGTVDSINAANASITIFGVTVLTNAGTSFEDKSDADQRPFGFANLRTGDYLEVRGFEEAAARTMTAVLVEREDADSRRELQGTAANVAQPNLVVLGVSVTTTGSTEYRDVNDAAISAATFFARAGNRLVKVRGSWNGTSFTAEQAELEN
jgi:hypothetical protein